MSLDKNFVLKLKQQNQEAFNKFYLDNVDIFFRYLNGNFFLSKKECEDIISTFFMKLRKWLPKYKENMSFEWYMRTIFKNTTKDFFKKQKDVSFSELTKNNETNQFEETIEDTEKSIHEFLELDYKTKEIEKQIKTLDWISQDIIHWKFIEWKTYYEISKLLNLKEENIRQKLSRAIKKIKLKLKWK